jgi:hypothetical protein
MHVSLKKPCKGLGRMSCLSAFQHKHTQHERITANAQHM